MTRHDQIAQDRENFDASAAGDHNDDGALTARLLSERLGRLRQARPGYERALEARLVSRLADSARPWWRRAFPVASRESGGHGRNHHRADTSRRRILAGLAAAAVLTLPVVGVSSLLSKPQEVNAKELLQKSLALAEDPALVQVKSFHLTARHTGQLPHQSGPPTTVTTEQWFVAPDRMRMESRRQGVDGKTIVTGVVHNGAEMRSYATPGADPVGPVGVIMGPGAPALEAGGDVIFIRRADRPGESLDGPGGPLEEGEEFSISLDNCPPPARQGDGTVANRPVHIIVMDHSTCLPANAPDELRGRSVTWVDQQTYLPLKMEHYGAGGLLRDRYEVTAVEYDVTIPDTVFSEIPPGTVMAPPRVVPLPKPPR